MNASLVIVRDAGFGRLVRRLLGAWAGQLGAPEFRLGNLAGKVIGRAQSGSSPVGLRSVGLRHSTLKSAFSVVWQARHSRLIAAP